MTTPVAPLTRLAGFFRRHAIDTRPLRHPAYRRMFIGNTISGFGFQLTAVAIPVQMYALTNSSLWVGLLGVAGLVPLVIFGVWGGAVADAVDRRRLLLFASGLMWATTLALLAQAITGLASPALLLLLTAVQSTAFAVQSPTRMSIIPRLVARDEIPAANTLGSTSFSASMVLGPLCAGLLLVQGGTAAAYAADALCFTVALWATIRLPALPPMTAMPAVPATAEVEDAGPTMTSGRLAGWAEVRAGLAYIIAAPVLVLSFAIDIAAMALALPRALFPQVAAERFGAGSIGWLYAAIAIGSMLAGLSSGWISRVGRQGLALVVAVVAWGLAVAAAGLAGQLWLAVLLLAVGGAADLISAVYRQTILQTYAPDGFQGRLQGVFIAVVAGGPRLGDLRAGVTAALVGPTVAWVGGGVATALVAAALAVRYPALARYTPTRPMKEAAYDETR